VDPLSEQELSDIEQRAIAATPRPWKSYLEGRDHTSGDSFIQTGGDDIYLSGATAADQDFIANARQDVPRLVAAIKIGLVSREKNRWKFAKWGAAMICFGIAFNLLGVFLAMELSANTMFFSGTSSFLAFLGASLVAWDIYVTQFGRRSK
jgi:hypothetical protein